MLERRARDQGSICCASTAIEPVGSRRRVLRLVDRELAAAGKRDAREAAPHLLADRIAGAPQAGEAGDLGLDVLAHEIEFGEAVFLGRMERQLARRQFEDEPAAAGVDVSKAQMIADESAIGVCVLGKDDDVRAGHHDAPTLWSAGVLAGVFVELSARHLRILERARWKQKNAGEDAGAPYSGRQHHFTSVGAALQAGVRLFGLFEREGGIDYWLDLAGFDPGPDHALDFAGDARLLRVGARAQRRAGEREP